MKQDLYYYSKDEKSSQKYFLKNSINEKARDFQAVPKQKFAILHFRNLLSIRKRKLSQIKFTNWDVAIITNRNTANRNFAYLISSHLQLKLVLFPYIKYHLVFNKEIKLSRLSKIYHQVHYFRYGLLLLCCIYSRSDAKMNKANPGNGILYEPQIPVSLTVHSLFTGDICCQQMPWEQQQGQQFIQRVFFTKTLGTNMHISVQNLNTTFLLLVNKGLRWHANISLCLKGKINWHSAWDMRNTFPYKFSEHHGSVLPPFCL